MPVRVVRVGNVGVNVYERLVHVRVAVRAFGHRLVGVV